MDEIPYKDFRGFVEAAKKVSAWRLIEGADWDNEIGALIEATAELDERPMLLFDKIKDYPRVFVWSAWPLPTTNGRRWLSEFLQTRPNWKSCAC
jgi:hypothetical protein